MSFGFTDELIAMAIRISLLYHALIAYPLIKIPDCAEGNVMSAVPAMISAVLLPLSTSRLPAPHDEHDIPGVRHHTLSC